MAIQHVDITDPNIHEPKGASTASANTVYVANGAGTGSWAKVGEDVLLIQEVLDAVQEDLDNGDISVEGRFFITTKLDDISTASNVLIPIIRSCRVVGASVVLGGPITVADALINFRNAAGAAMGTQVTVAFTSSGEGDQYAFTATGSNVITGPSYIEVETNGGSTDAAPLFVTVELEYVLN